MPNLTADLTDDVLTTLTDAPGATARRIAKALRADLGAVQRTLRFLVTEHYVAQTGKGGRETYRRA
jgi:DNA-binding IclR family transcriptional regulator